LIKGRLPFRAKSFSRRARAAAMRASSPTSRMMRMETGNTLLPSLARRRSRGAPGRLAIPEAQQLSPVSALHPAPADTCADAQSQPISAVQVESTPRRFFGRTLSLSEKPGAIAPNPKRLLTLPGHAGEARPQQPPGTAPPPDRRRPDALFPDGPLDAGARYFDELADALDRLRDSEPMPQRRLAIHKVARMLGEVPDGADSHQVAAVMAAGDALARLVDMLRDNCIADCATTDTWLLHCALALCVNLACHDPEAIVRGANLGPFVLSGLDSDNERTRMLCAAGAHNLATCLDGAALVLDPPTRATLEALAASDNIGAAHHARAALAEAAKRQGGGRGALRLLRAAMAVIGVAVVLLAFVILLTLSQEHGRAAARRGRLDVRPVAAVPVEEGGAWGERTLEGSRLAGRGSWAVEVSDAERVCE